MSARKLPGPELGSLFRELGRVARDSGLILVTAMHPAMFLKGVSANFRDETGDVYYLSIYSSTHEWHEVSYNSSQPEITNIYWSDYNFTVSGGDPNRAKPQFQVVSPAIAG